MPTPPEDLCDAATANNLESAKTIIATNLDSLKPNPKPDPGEGEATPYQDLEAGDSPLMCAVRNGHIEMVRLPRVGSPFVVPHRHPAYSTNFHDCYSGGLAFTAILQLNLGAP